ncbi:MAG: hypothetical protein IPK66_12165 [Rhodospirillales bacterium]|nr:hypothetical protein [Rhodospirillales bacterium]
MDGTDADRRAPFGQLTLHFDQRDVTLLFPQAQDEARLRFNPVRILVAALHTARRRRPRPRRIDPHAEPPESGLGPPDAATIPQLGHPRVRSIRLR